MQKISAEFQINNLIRELSISDGIKFFLTIPPSIGAITNLVKSELSKRIITKFTKTDIIQNFVAYSGNSDKRSWLILEGSSPLTNIFMTYQCC